MKGFRLFFMLALLAAFTVGTASAADYYVFANQHGQNCSRPRPQRWLDINRRPVRHLGCGQTSWGDRDFCNPGRRKVLDTRQSGILNAIN